MASERKVAFVTGAGSGIGRAIAQALAADGHQVIVGDINDAGAAETVASLAGDGHSAQHLDVTDPTVVTDVATSVLADVGTVDILVNCAGTDIVKPFLESDEELWKWLIELNFMGVLRTTKAFLPAMVEQKWGRLINIGSDAGRVGSSGEGAYSGAKGGVIAFTKTIAREMARHNITANTVCPGPTETPPVKNFLETGGEKYITAMKRGIPLGRLGQPEDVAAAVAFFATEPAGFITGQTISVSGGLSMV